ncbi:hypothetical protein AVEN_167123-1 [Araneus ventricosus]|uniref:Uncharacterized protein n=1 Tax=Araneus ventricosus TaxID=182803 RepID=A0A4Y2S5X2_ARAVE|nr:hypothetical protein AVEN_147258-1 [Araneus ventricosus]GBN83566.1 hypothetical protein AVEN_167123-1 [Araneus ventricosus]
MKLKGIRTAEVRTSGFYGIFGSRKVNFSKKVRALTGRITSSNPCMELAITLNLSHDDPPKREGVRSSRLPWRESRNKDFILNVAYPFVHSRIRDLRVVSRRPDSTVYVELVYVKSVVSQTISGRCGKESSKGVAGSGVVPLV